jgi:ABC-type oligopeptide transport system substrate-binding subunit
MDPERRRALTHQAARALLVDKGVIPIVFLKNTWAGWRDRVTYRQVSNDIRNPATGDTENPATPVMLMPRPEPVRHWF